MWLDDKRCGRSVVGRACLPSVLFWFSTLDASRTPMTTPPLLGMVCEERRKEDVRLTGLRRKER